MMGSAKPARGRKQKTLVELKHGENGVLDRLDLPEDSLTRAERSRRRSTSVSRGWVRSRITAGNGRSRLPSRGRIALN
jgi:hypothetical protein